MTQNNLSDIERRRVLPIRRKKTWKTHLFNYGKIISFIVICFVSGYLTGTFIETPNLQTRQAKANESVEKAECEVAFNSAKTTVEYKSDLFCSINNQEKGTGMSKASLSYLSLSCAKENHFSTNNESGYKSRSVKSIMTGAYNMRAGP